MKGRVSRLEQRLLRVEEPRGDPGPLATEVREIDRTIKRLEAEIAEAEAVLPLEALARSRAEFEEFDATLDGLELDQKIEALKAEISILEAEEPGGVHS
jgi:DNA repair exonuclease SbcCD ATPase subunit